MVARECIVLARLIRATNGQDINLNSRPFFNPVYSREFPRIYRLGPVNARNHARELILIRRAIAPADLELPCETHREEKIFGKRNSKGGAWNRSNAVIVPSGEIPSRDRKLPPEAKIFTLRTPVAREIG